MAVTAPDEGEQQLLRYMLGIEAIGDGTTPTTGFHKIRLYQNNATPDEDTTEDNTIPDVNDTIATNDVKQVNSDLSNPEEDLDPGNFTISTVSNVTTAEHTQVTFTFTGAKNVYGYYVVDDNNGNVLWAERFAGAPFQLPSGGGQIVVTPRVTLN